MGIFKPEPTDVSLAFDGQIRKGVCQPVLMSHGNSGRMRNHHLTAKALADVGYIVIAPQHSADHFIGSKKTAGAMALRIEELRRALVAVEVDPVLGMALDFTQVHALGYSLGGATVKAAAGAEIDLEAAKAHFDVHGNDDAAFCEDLPFLWHLYQRLRKPVSIDNMPNRFSISPFVNGLVAVVAPIGQGLEIEPERFAASQVLVVAIEGDQIAQPRFHAEAIAAAVPPEQFAGIISVPGHHYAFIAPYSERVTDKEDIPVVKDPEGFYRAAFINRVNAEIVDFFAAAYSLSVSTKLLI